jgi:hypothetical protein
MVTAAILGERGMLGSVVKRRWAEHGAEITTAATADYIVNCIRPDDLLLSERLSETAILIQPSTDAIAEDSDYAVTKRILERIPAVTIRAGLVDITRQPGVAYRNWRCNPITPLEWADLAWDLRDRPGVHVAGREPVSRFGVASLVAYLWDRPAPVPAWSEVPLSRIQRDRDREWDTLMEALTEYRDWLRS